MGGRQAREAGALRNSPPRGEGFCSHGVPPAGRRGSRRQEADGPERYPPPQDRIPCYTLRGLLGKLTLGLQLSRTPKLFPLSALPFVVPAGAGKHRTSTSCVSKGGCRCSSQRCVRSSTGARRRLPRHPQSFLWLRPVARSPPLGKPETGDPFPFPAGGSVARPRCHPSHSLNRRTVPQAADQPPPGPPPGRSASPRPEGSRARLHSHGPLVPRTWRATVGGSLPWRKDPPCGTPTARKVCERPRPAGNSRRPGSRTSPSALQPLRLPGRSRGTYHLQRGLGAEGRGASPRMPHSPPSAFWKRGAESPPTPQTPPGLRVRTRPLTALPELLPPRPSRPRRPDPAHE